MYNIKDIKSISYISIALGNNLIIRLNVYYLYL
jgi:hypothetical protein